jgi:hypothetical protein
MGLVCLPWLDKLRWRIAHLLQGHDGSLYVPECRGTDDANGAPIGQQERHRILSLRQFDIPSVRIQASDVGRREHGGIEHIGQVGVALAAHTKTDKARDLSRLIRAMPAQVDQGVADAIGLIEDVPHLVTGFFYALLPQFVDGPQPPDVGPLLAQAARTPSA